MWGFLQVYGARCLDGDKAAPLSFEDASASAFDRVEAGLTGPSSVYALSSGTGFPHDELELLSCKLLTK